MNNNHCNFVRADFHLHTRKDKQFKYSEEENQFINLYIQRLKDEDIKLGVITNHNKFDLGEFKALKKKAKKEEIYLFPGVELGVTEGSSGHIHLLIVFNPDDWITNTDDFINKFLDSVFGVIANRENSDKPCDHNLNDLLNILENYNKDYFLIFAHVDADKGFLKEINEGRIKNLLENNYFKKRVLGLQKVRKSDSKKKVKTLFNSNISILEGSDPKSLNEIGRGDPIYLKLGNFSFSALKYALLYPDDRVSNEIPNINHCYISNISFIGGKLDGENIDFSPHLNSLIGIRGSGKSSILEVLAYALNIDNPQYDKEYKKKLVSEALGSGGKIILTLIDDLGNTYKITRILNEESIISNEDGTQIQTQLNNILKSPVFFGQNDLSLLKPGHEHLLLDNFINIDKSTQNEIKELETQIVEAIKKLQNIKKLKEEIIDLESETNHLKSQLDQLSQYKILDKLNKQTNYKEDINNLESLITNSRKQLDILENDSNKFQSNIPSTVILSSYNTHYQERVIKILSTIKFLGKDIEYQLNNMNSEILKLDEITQEIKSTNFQLNEEFAEVRREINEFNSNLNPDSILERKEQIKKNEKRLKSLKEACNQENRIIDNLTQLIEKRNKKLLEIVDIYIDKINYINSSQNEIQLKLEPKGDKETFIDSLKDFFRGSGIRENAYKQICNNFDDWLDIIEDYMINNAKKINNILSSNNQLNNYKNTIDNNYMKLVSERVPNKIDILYHNKPLYSYSLGQRSSALLLFLLTQEKPDVIIIDQPEDDLDNQIIFKELIKSIKKVKKSTQLIFATHNANIPVLGDSENILVTNYNKDEIKVEIGNIDNPKTQDSIINILEGGKEAFKKRNQIYSEW